MGRYTFREIAQHTVKSFSIKGNKNLEQFGQKKKKKSLGTSHYTKTKSRQIPGPVKQNTKVLIKP